MYIGRKDPSPRPYDQNRLLQIEEKLRKKAESCKHGFIDRESSIGIARESLEIINDYQYRQHQGYEMAINEVKPLLKDVLKVLDKPCKTRNMISDYLKQNPSATWDKIRQDLDLSSNALIAHHLPRINLINKIKEVINA